MAEAITCYAFRLAIIFVYEYNRKVPPLYSETIWMKMQLQGIKWAGLFRAVRDYRVTFPGLPESPYYGRTAIHWFLQHSFSDSGKTGELHPECYSYQLVAGRHPAAIKYLVYISTIKQGIPYYIRPADSFLIQKHFQVFGQAV